MGGYLWCLKCCRTYRDGKQRTVNNIQKCYYAVCEARASVSTMPWSSIRILHPHYPEFPDYGHAYPAFKLTAADRLTAGRLGHE